MEQLYKALENNIYEGLMRLSTRVDQKLCVMITWTIMLLKLSVGCLDSLVVQLYKALENNIYEGRDEVIIIRLKTVMTT